MYVLAASRLELDDVGMMIRPVITVAAISIGLIHTLGDLSEAALHELSELKRLHHDVIGSSREGRAAMGAVDGDACHIGSAADRRMAKGEVLSTCAAGDDDRFHY